MITELVIICLTQQDIQSHMKPRELQYTDKRSLTRGAVFNKSRGKRVEFSEAAPRYQKHDSCCPYAQLTTRSSGQAEKAALVFQIEIGNQLPTFNSGGKENKDEEERNNTNKQSNNCSNRDM